MSRISSGNLKLITAYSGWWVLWIAIQTTILRNMGYAWDIALKDAAITQAVLSLSGYIINTTLRFYQPRQILKYVFTLSVAMAILSAYAQRFGLLYSSSDQPEYLQFVNNSLLVRGAFDWLMISFITITSWMWFYMLDQKETDRRREDTDRLSRQAELSSLRMQLQPHFLFNSLNSISALVTVEPAQARNMIQQLSDFLRGTVKKDDKQLVSLEEELHHLQLYLEIEKIRFGHRLNAIVNVDSDSAKSVLPSLLLQPIVENAIKFGLYDTIGEITISITAKTENDYLTIEIKNPFDPDTSQPQRGTGFGLNSVHRRLYLLYSQSNLLTTLQSGTVFTTQIKIPQFT